MNKATEKWFTKKRLAERYDTSTRSIDRWVSAGKFPPPDGRLPSGWPIWADTTIQKHERRSATPRCATAPP
jgi:hypothetical protein